MFPEYAEIIYSNMKQFLVKIAFSHKTLHRMHMPIFVPVGNKT